MFVTAKVTVHPLYIGEYYKMFHQQRDDTCISLTNPALRTYTVISLVSEFKRIHGLLK